LIAANRLAVEHVRIERSDFGEAAPSLEPLLARLRDVVRKVNGKRIVLDTSEALFAGQLDTDRRRAELRHMFGWLKTLGLTAVITSEQGDGTLSRYGQEEYVADCVILLENRVQNQVATRRLRVVKYRGSAHAEDEYPFLIDSGGITALPVLSGSLDYPALTERVSTGVAGLDAMLSGGLYRGSSMLISGGAGTGKSILAAYFIDASCRRGERCLFFCYEGGPHQVVRDMHSVGIDLGPWVERGLLRFVAARGNRYGLDLIRAQTEIDGFQPGSVVLDPITELRGAPADAHSRLVRLLDLMKVRGITTVLTCPEVADAIAPHPEAHVTSTVDNWVTVATTGTNGQRNRVLCVRKSRGTSISHRICEFVLSNDGIRLANTGPGPGRRNSGQGREHRQAQGRQRRD
jgi:circadian clock protein KaiC